MLEKIKKYKFLFLLVFFLFIFFSNNVNANSDSITYNDTTINTAYFNKHQNAFLIYDKTDNKYLSFELFRTSTSSNPNPRFYIVREDKDYMYISGRSDNYFYNCTAIYNYNISSGTIGSVSSSTNYGGDTSSTNSRNASYKIDKNRYSFVYKADNVKIYTDETCTTENSTSEFFFAGAFPKWHIEYYEKFQMYYAFTDWYDIRNTSISAFYAYGDHLSYNGNPYDIDDHWDFEGQVTEYKGTDGDDKFIERVGFPLNVYGHYSYLQLNLEDHSYVLDGLDFTEETLKGSEYEDCLNPFTHLNLYLDERTNTPTVYSNFIQKDLIDGSWFSISFDNGESFSDIFLDFEETHIINGIEYIRFYYKLYANDTYTFRLRIYDKNHKTYEVLKSFTINSYGSIIDSNGSDTVTATPFINAYADTSIIRFSTQTFKERINLNTLGDSVSSLRYDAYYIDEEAYQIFGDNYEDWIIMDVGYEDFDKVTDGYPYFFKTEFSFESLEDGDKFYFVFYDKKLGCFSNVTTYVLENKTELLTISQNITFNNDRFNKLYNFFNEHFGFLNYPLEFIINLLNRIFNIKYEEPILHIPQLKVPTTGEVIFNGLDYNLNSVLELPVVPTIYNIYLIAVDFVLVIYFVIHTKNTLEGVLGNG